MMKQLEKEIHEAYQFLREHNSTISSEAIEYMRDVALLGVSAGVVHKKNVRLRKQGIGGIVACVGFDNAKELDGQRATVILVPHGR